MSSVRNFYLFFIFLSFVIFPLNFGSTQPGKFNCGYDRCDKGYDVCINDTDLYCLPCNVYFKETCGTANEKDGCHLYCQGLITNELEVAQGRIKSLVGQLSGLKNETSKARSSQGNTWNIWMIISVSFNGLAVVVISIVAFKYLKARLARHPSEIDENNSSKQEISDNTPLTADCLRHSTASSELSSQTGGCCGGSQDKCYGRSHLTNVTPVDETRSKFT